MFLGSSTSRGGTSVAPLALGRCRVCQAPNKWLQLTSQLVTPFAYAKVAPSCLAAEPGC